MTEACPKQDSTGRDRKHQWRDEEEEMELDRPPAKERSKDDFNVALEWKPNGRRKRGRPKTIWRRMVEVEGTMQAEAP